MLPMGDLPERRRLLRVTGFAESLKVLPVHPQSTHVDGPDVVGASGGRNCAGWGHGHGADGAYVPHSDTITVADW
jgi:hypothetical protein